MPPSPCRFPAAISGPGLSGPRQKYNRRGDERREHGDRGQHRGLARIVGRSSTMIFRTADSLIAGAIGGAAFARVGIDPGRPRDLRNFDRLRDGRRLAEREQQARPLPWRVESCRRREEVADPKFGDPRDTCRSSSPRPRASGFRCPDHTPRIAWLDETTSAFTTTSFVGVAADRHSVAANLDHTLLARTKHELGGWSSIGARRGLIHAGAQGVAGVWVTVASTHAEYCDGKTSTIK